VSRGACWAAEAAGHGWRDRLRAVVFLGTPHHGLAAIDGFSLHAQVHVAAHDRERLEHLFRYVARPIATERLSLSAQGQVVYELRRPLA
jgi:hypothetical protein